MSEQLELFPEMMYEDFEQDGKKYRRHTKGNGISYRKRLEQRMKVKRFIDEYKKTI